MRHAPIGVHRLGSVFVLHGIPENPPASTNRLEGALALLEPGSRVPRGKVVIRISLLVIFPARTSTTQKCSLVDQAKPMIMSVVVQIPDVNDAHEIAATLPPALFSVGQEQVVVHVERESFIDDPTDGRARRQCVGETVGAAVSRGRVHDQSDCKDGRVVVFP